MGRIDTDTQQFDAAFFKFVQAAVKGNQFGRADKSEIGRIKQEQSVGAVEIAVDVKLIDNRVVGHYRRNNKIRRQIANQNGAAIAVFIIVNIVSFCRKFKVFDNQILAVQRVANKIFTFAAVGVVIIFTGKVFVFVAAAAVKIVRHIVGKSAAAVVVFPAVAFIFIIIAVGAVFVGVAHGNLLIV